MFAKMIIAAFIAIVALFGSGESQYVYPSYYPSTYYGAAYAPAAYSPYYGYAAGYPAYYAWGSNKANGKGPAPAPAQSLTNNQ